MAAIRERLNRGGKRTYQVQIRRRGFPSRNKSFYSLTAARMWAQKVESEMQLGTFLPELSARGRTVRDLLLRYKSEILAVHKPQRKQDQGPQLDWWIAKIGHHALSDLTPSVIAKARDELSATPFGRKKQKLRAPATVVRYLAVLSHAFNTAVREWQWLSRSPLEMVSKPKVRNERERYLTPAEIAALREALAVSDNRVLPALFEIALSTGMRKGELLKLRWADVRWPTSEQPNSPGRTYCFLRLTRTKNGDTRSIPLMGRGFSALMSLLPGDSLEPPRELLDQLIFPGSTDDQQPLDFKRSWATALRRAGIPDFRFHDIRHTTASYLAMQGCTLREIAEVLGHRTLAMVKRYSHLSSEHLVGVVGRLSSSPIGFNGTDTAAGTR